MGQVVEDVFGPLRAARPSVSLRHAAPGGGVELGAAHEDLLAEDGGLGTGADGAGVLDSDAD
eukprot:3050513-Alexandrium_andersonii.AAC.1